MKEQQRGGGSPPSEKLKRDPCGKRHQLKKGEERSSRKKKEHLLTYNQSPGGGPFKRNESIDTKKNWKSWLKDIGRIKGKAVREGDVGRNGKNPGRFSA